ncbi:hypothetical protein HPB47_006526 [Ixodes persulcatus]|uniref:Uncharacterized protein n=1 Tax=Ixodes persulcatus TaxID=34615 RepID=A0AC60PAM7_IXOPE|nr:hypothetical protein HPB47_006526 [Ixodes persulcatus]
MSNFSLTPPFLASQVGNGLPGGNREPPFIRGERSPKPSVTISEIGPTGDGVAAQMRIAPRLSELTFSTGRSQYDTSESGGPVDNGLDVSRGGGHPPCKLRRVSDFAVA